MLQGQFSREMIIQVNQICYNLEFWMKILATSKQFLHMDGIYQNDGDDEASQKNVKK